MDANIVRLSLHIAHDALHAAMMADHFPEREEVLGIVRRVDEIARSHAARTTTPACVAPSVEEPEPAHVCPFSSCLDTGLLANGDLCPCSTHGSVAG
jgi:hypothetical protein